MKYTLEQKIAHLQSCVLSMQGRTFYCEDDEGFLRRWTPPEMHPPGDAAPWITRPAVKGPAETAREEVVERMAKAIAKSQEVDWYAASQTTRTNYLVDASAALAAIEGEKKDG